MKKGKIGEDKYTEHWSIDGHTYVEVPKWVIETVKNEGRTGLENFAEMVGATVIFSGVFYLVGIAFMFGIKTAIYLSNLI